MSYADGIYFDGHSYRTFVRIGDARIRRSFKTREAALEFRAKIPKVCVDCGLDFPQGRHSKRCVKCANTRRNRRQAEWNKANYPEYRAMLTYLANARRHERIATDAEFAAKERLKIRVKRALNRRKRGQVKRRKYVPRPSCQIPDYLPSCTPCLDIRSKYIWSNRIDSLERRAYALRREK